MNASLYNRKESTPTDDAATQEAYEKIRRFVNFSKWGLTPEGERHPADWNVQNMKNFNLLLNFGYSNNECQTMRDYLGNLAPQTENLIELER